MVAQRGGRTFAADAPVKTPKSSQGVKERADSGGEPKAKRRLSFKEKHALDTLPARIASLEKEIALLQAKLSDSALYARDRRAFDQASTALVRAQEELAEAEHQWLELEILREEIQTMRET
jgi:ATP-binding cassette subfamily F protein uup